MARLRRSLSSISTLTAFESAARLGSFTQAATELGVTQAAVSRQIKQLEGDLNTPLFVRAHRRVVLTPAGAALAGTVTTAFDTITEMIDTIRQPMTSDTVSLGASLAFSHFWILPRLPECRAQHPDLKLRLLAEDNLVDLRRNRLDVAIRFGQPPFADARSLGSLPDSAFPVCSPKLLDELGMVAEDADLLRLPLIVAETVNPSWLTWKSWAQGLGLGPALGVAADRSRLRFNHFTDSIQAALNGEGVALGWSALLAAQLADGRLVRLGQHALQQPNQHHLIVPLGREPSPAAKLFIGWLTTSFADHQPRG